MNCAVGSPSYVRILRGRFVDGNGEPYGSWNYFICQIDTDGTELGFGCVASYYQAIIDAQEWADEAGIAVRDLSDEVTA